MANKIIYRTEDEVRDSAKIQLGFDKIEEDICLKHHLKRAIRVVVVLAHLTIYAETMMCYRAEFEIYLLH